MEIIKFTRTNDGYDMDSSAYPIYVHNLRHHISDHILQYMNASWHYDHTDARCPHDAILNTITIIDEPYDKQRSAHIQLNLHAADTSNIRVEYFDVLSYSIEKSRSTWPIDDNTHGSWLIDELLVHDNSIVTHEIIFTNSRLFIKCKDFKYSVIV